MSMLGDVARWVLIGGPAYPAEVEKVLSGEMQCRYAHARTKTDKDVLVHPDYLFHSIARTTDAIRGAFTLRLIGQEGMTTEELKDFQSSNVTIPQLELLDEIPMSYKLLGVGGGVSFLRITKMININNGLITLRELGAQMLEENPTQAYTIYAEELRQPTGQDIGGEYTYKPMDQSRTEIAARVFQQYSPYYKNLRSID